MSSTRFQLGQSGNPDRQQSRKPEKVILGDQPNDIGREVAEALQQQTLKDALAGKRLAIRKVLKMIEKRERALEAKSPVPGRKIELKHHCQADNANEALRILGIAEPDPGFPTRWKVHAWATQAALSRPGRKKFDRREVNNIKFFTFDPDTLRWPRGRVE